MSLRLGGASDEETVWKPGWFQLVGFQLLVESNAALYHTLQGSSSSEAEKRRIHCSLQNYFCVMRQKAGAFHTRISPHTLNHSGWVKARVTQIIDNFKGFSTNGSCAVISAKPFENINVDSQCASWKQPWLQQQQKMLACVQNKLGLSVGNSGGLRPCCLAGAEGAAGCQWSVPAEASGNGVTLTLTPILTPVSSWVQGRVQRLRVNSTPTTEQLDSLSRMSSFWPPSKQEASQAPDVWAVSMKSPSEHRSVSAYRPINLRLSEVHARPER
eukprot:superscaffoldBa00001828_g12194